MFFKHGKHKGGGWWVVFGGNRRFRLDLGAHYDADGWLIKQTRIATWRRDEYPPIFKTKTFTH